MFSFGFFGVYTALACKSWGFFETAKNIIKTILQGNKNKLSLCHD